METYKNLTDEDLTQLLKTADPHAFREICNRYWASMYLYARKLLPNIPAAEQVVEQALTILWTNRANIPPGISLSVHLYTLVRRNGLAVIHDEPENDAFLQALNNYINSSPDTKDQATRDRELIISIKRTISELPQEIREWIEQSKSGRFNTGEE